MTKIRSGAYRRGWHTWWSEPGLYPDIPDHGRLFLNCGHQVRQDEAPKKGRRFTCGLCKADAERAVK